MRIDLLMLSALAAGALAALIESARRAAPGLDGEDDAHDLVAGIVPRATIEELERASAGLDDHAARMLIGLGVSGVLVGALCLVLGCASAEIGAVVAAAGAGLALPGLSWACDVHRRRAEIEGRIAQLRGRIDATESASRLMRSAAPPRRA